MEPNERGKKFIFVEELKMVKFLLSFLEIEGERPVRVNVP